MRGILSLMTPLVRDLLARRGVVGETEIHDFLNPNYDLHLHDPFLLSDMEKAVMRILKAIEKKEKIILYTDYDTDGIPAGVLLHDFFKDIGYFNFANYIPHRNREGYGLNIAAIDRFAEEGATLIITADCGITDHKEAAHAQSLGIDVIITDHHLPLHTKDENGEDRISLPPAFAVINPQRNDDEYPFRFLCGAGVAFKLVQGIIKRGRELGLITLGEGKEKWLLDMAGIATISDMVPLVGENRVLAYYGLKVLQKSPRPGLKRLFRKAYVPQQHITEEDIGFVVGPRINVASRIDTPEKAFRLLATRDDAEAELLVGHLEDLNKKRKILVANVMKEVKGRLFANELRDVLVLGNPAWFPGILGLAAQRIAEEFKRPVFLWGKEGGETIKGSCRSDGTINIHELMGHAKDAFLDFGGHEFSGGFSVANDRIHFLEDALNGCLHEVPRKKSAEGNVGIDGECLLGEVTWDMFRDIQRVAPFGKGNPRPLFLFKNITVTGVNYFGKEKGHARLTVGDEASSSVSAIKFFGAGDDFLVQCEPGSRINLMAHIEKSIFRNIPELRLRIVDVSFAV